MHETRLLSNSVNYLILLRNLAVTHLAICSVAKRSATKPPAVISTAAASVACGGGGSFVPFEIGRLPRQARRAKNS